MTTLLLLVAGAAVGALAVWLAYRNTIESRNAELEDLKASLNITKANSDRALKAWEDGAAELPWLIHGKSSFKRLVPKPWAPDPADERITKMALEAELRDTKARLALALAGGAKGPWSGSLERLKDGIVSSHAWARDVLAAQDRPIEVKPYPYGDLQERLRMTELQVEGFRQASANEAAAPWNARALFHKLTENNPAPWACEKDTDRDPLSDYAEIMSRGDKAVLASTPGVSWDHAKSVELMQALCDWVNAMHSHLVPPRNP